MKLRSCTLYRAFTEDGTLLYVGATVNVGARLNHHRAKPWWMEAARVELEHFPSVEAANAAEKKAIEAEAPRENRMVPKKVLTDEDLVERRRKRAERRAHAEERAKERRQQRESFEQNSYLAKFSCGNCGRIGPFWFPKGVRVEDHPCSVCGLKEWVPLKRKAAA